MLKAVIFDIGGVLLTLGTKQYLAELEEELGVNDLQSLYNQNAQRLDRGEVTEAALWEQAAQRPVAEDTFDHVFPKYFRPVESMLQFAQELRDLGIQTAILSNTVPSHVRAMRQMGFLEGFDPIVFSCEIRIRKPDDAAIQYVLDRLPFAPHEIAYIDDIADNVAMGKRAGVRSILHEGDYEATRRAVLDE